MNVDIKKIEEEVFSLSSRERAKAGDGLDQKEGKGFYTFLIHGTKNVVKKQAVWKTVHFVE